MKKIFMIGLIMISFINVYAKKNPYHTPGTKEYSEVTSKLLGLWTISSFTQKDKDKMEPYDGATVEFIEKGISGGEAIFRFKVKKDIVNQRINVWNKKGVTLTIDSYVVVCKLDFKISDKGVLVYLENPKSTVDIEGNGDQLENFQQTEKSFIETQSEMKESGGVGNMIGAKILKDVTGTDFVPRIPSQVNYKNLTDNSVDLITLQKLNFKLSK